MKNIINPPKVVYADGETRIRNNKLFRKYVNANNITYVAAKTLPMCVDRMLLTCINKNLKPNMHWAEHIYPIILTNSKATFGWI